MRLLDVFSGITSVSAEEARARVARTEAGGLSLLDVRETSEYERAHLPGALHIPLSELPGRLGELDQAKPLIVY